MHSRNFLSIILVFISLNVTAAQHNTTIASTTDKEGNVFTLNGMGRMFLKMDPITKMFINFCKDKKNIKILEIGAAYGKASQAVLETVAEVVINDLDKTPFRNV